MNKATAAAALGAFITASWLFSQAGAEQIQRVAGPDWVGCSSKEHYQELVRIAFEEDQNAFAEMIASGKCFALKDGAPVSVIDETSSDLGIVAIRGEGSRGAVWTARDAIR